MTIVAFDLMHSIVKKAKGSSDLIRIQVEHILAVTSLTVMFDEVKQVGAFAVVIAATKEQYWFMEVKAGSAAEVKQLEVTTTAVTWDFTFG